MKIVEKLLSAMLFLGLIVLLIKIMHESKYPIPSEIAIWSVMYFAISIVVLAVFISVGIICLFFFNKNKPSFRYWILIFLHLVIILIYTILNNVD